MAIPLRLLRAHADALPGMRPRFSARELDQQDRIVAAALSIFVHFGFENITFAGFATAIRLSPGTIRKYFIDLDCIFAEILSRHLQDITKAIGQIPWDAPDLHAARRAAYAAATRSEFGAPTPRHSLLLHHRHRLPPDLLDPIEEHRASIAELLAPRHAKAALTLLDMPDLDTAGIDAMLAALDPPPALIQPAVSQPARPPFTASPPPKTFEMPPRFADALAEARAGPA